MNIFTTDGELIEEFFELEVKLEWANETVEDPDDEDEIGDGVILEGVYLNTPMLAETDWWPVNFVFCDPDNPETIVGSAVVASDGYTAPRWIGNRKDKMMLIIAFGLEGEEITIRYTIHNDGSYYFEYVTA